MEEMYYIQDTRSYCGNSVMWWAVDGHGYTSDIAKAWKVSKHYAERMIRSRDTDKAWPVSEVNKHIRQHIDHQDLRDVEPLSRSAA
jgi:cell division ATPase FtsA